MKPNIAGIKMWHRYLTVLLCTRQQNTWVLNTFNIKIRIKILPLRTGEKYQTLCDMQVIRYLIATKLPAIWQARNKQTVPTQNYLNIYSWIKVSLFMMHKISSNFGNAHKTGKLHIRQRYGANGFCDFFFFSTNKRITEVKQNECTQSSVTAVNFILDTFNRGILNLRQHLLELLIDFYKVDSLCRKTWNCFPGETKSNYKPEEMFGLLFSL